MSKYIVNYECSIIHNYEVGISRLCTRQLTVLNCGLFYDLLLWTFKGRSSSFAFFVLSFLLLYFSSTNALFYYSELIPVVLCDPLFIHDFIRSPSSLYHWFSWSTSISYAFRHPGEVLSCVSLCKCALCRRWACALILIFISIPANQVFMYFTKPHLQLV